MSEGSLWHVGRHNGNVIGECDWVHTIRKKTYNVNCGEGCIVFMDLVWTKPPIFDLRSKRLQKQCFLCGGLARKTQINTPGAPGSRVLLIEPTAQKMQCLKCVCVVCVCVCVCVCVWGGLIINACIHNHKPLGWQSWLSGNAFHLNQKKRWSFF